jgi:large subunit ribosomal protein L15
MNLSDVLARVKKRPSRKRCGRGRGSGLGKTSGRGHKGAAARSGWKRRYHYEGGQVPLARRMPKRGFSNHPFRTRCDVINLTELEGHFQDGEAVRLEVLAARGLLNPIHGRLKVLGNGDLKKKLAVFAYAASASARKKIEAAGGTLETTRKPRRRPPPRLPPKPKTKAEEESGGGAETKGEAKKEKKEKGGQEKGVQTGAPQKGAPQTKSPPKGGGADVKGAKPKQGPAGES